MGIFNPRKFLNFVLKYFGENGAILNFTKRKEHTSVLAH